MNGSADRIRGADAGSGGEMYCTGSYMPDAGRGGAAAQECVPRGAPKRNEEATMSTMNSRRGRAVRVPEMPRGARREQPRNEQPLAALGAPAAEVEACIAARAYEIYRARNGGPGDALADWLRAEREIRGALRRGLNAENHRGSVGPSRGTARRRAKAGESAISGDRQWTI